MLDAIAAASRLVARLPHLALTRAATARWRASGCSCRWRSGATAFVVRPAWPRPGVRCRHPAATGGREGKDGVPLVEGPSGIGKSRLFAEAADAATGRGFMIARGRADELRRLVPLAPLMSALGQTRRALGVPERLASTDTGDLRLWSLDQRSLVPGPASYPLAWMPARNSDINDTGLNLLYEVLEQEGANWMVLEPLNQGAVIEIAEDVLGLFSPSS